MNIKRCNVWFTKIITARHPICNKLYELLFLQFVKCQKCQKKYHLYCTIKKDRDGNITKVKCCEKKKEILLTLNSNAAIPIPEAAAVPAIPTKWPDPILLANNDAPSCNF